MHMYCMTNFVIYLCIWTPPPRNLSTPFHITNTKCESMVTWCENLALNCLQPCHLTACEYTLSVLIKSNSLFLKLPYGSDLFHYTECANYSWFRSLWFFLLSSPQKRKCAATHQSPSQFCCCRLIHHIWSVWISNISVQQPKWCNRYGLWAHIK